MSEWFFRKGSRRLFAFRKDKTVGFLKRLHLLLLFSWACFVSLCVAQNGKHSFFLFINYYYIKHLYREYNYVITTWEVCDFYTNFNQFDIFFYNIGTYL